ncbi:MAG TPA: Ig domain-containing protein, partial [Bryobacteraceae bacterium]|nr:Ig domain-containing protein [Bryobacteraceae bacterium]
MRSRCVCALSFVLLAAQSSQAQNPIQIENANPGTTGWQLSNPAVNREIEGYASLTSVNKGGQISFFVSTSDSSFHLEIFRTGWYGGVGARLLTTVSNLPGKLQQTPTPDPVTGLIECQWTSSYTLNVPSTWTSGIFLGRLTGDQSGKQSYIIFVVRDDTRASKLLFESSVTTFEAYNFWPNGANGKSLYNWAPGGRAWKVSFNRPYVLGNSYTSSTPGAASGVGAGEYLANLQPGPATGYQIPPAGFEYNLVRWLEKNGYDVSYITDIDLHENASLLNNHSAYLSVGHNEYWSMQMLQNLQGALSRGLNAAFFSSNTLYWQVRFEPGFNAAPDRTMVCYKTDAAADDPDYTTNPQLATVEWRNAPVNMPEAALVGVEYIGDPVTSDIVISNASHWLMQGTGLNNGDHLTGLLGYEVDGFVPSISPSNTAVLASSPVGPLHDFDNPPGFSCGTSVCDANTTWYAGAHSFVFASGSMFWSWGLDDYNAPALRPAYSNTAAQQITKNVLASFTNPVSITTSSLPAGNKGTAYGPYQLTATGGGPPYTWTASGVPSGMSLSSAGVLSGVPSVSGTSSVMVTVTDSAQHTASASFNLTISATVVIATTSPLPSGTVGTAYTQTFAASGGASPYQWSVTSGTLPAGLTLSAAGQLSGTPTTAGTSSFRVQVKDSSSLSATQNFQLTVNTTFAITTISPLPGGTVGTAYTQTFAASGGAPPYQWSVTSGTLPAGLALSTAGQLSGTPTAAGTSNITVQAKDSNSLTATQNFKLTIGAGLAITTTSPVPSGTVGTAYTQTLTASGGTSPYQWSVTSGTLPAGLALSTAGQLSGTPTAAGTSSFTVQVKDSNSLTATRTLEIPVIGPLDSFLATTMDTTKWCLCVIDQPSGSQNPQVVIQQGSGQMQIQPKAGVAGSNYNGYLSVPALDMTNAALSVQVVQATTGSGFADTSFVLAVDANNWYRFIVEGGTLYLQTMVSGVKSGPAIAYSAVTQKNWRFRHNPAVNQMIFETSGDGSTWTVQLQIAAQVPVGALLVGLNAGTWGAESSPGQATFANLHWEQNSNPPFPVITTTSPLPGGTVGTAYTQTLAASGGTSPYQWSVTTGTLPAGLALSAAGQLTGTPTAAGTASFTVQVKDSNSLTATQSFQLTISAALAITTTSPLPSGTVGTAYTQTLAASGGTSPYQWSVTSGTLPAGLALSTAGQLSGTPTTAGTASFTVQVKDSNSLTATQNFQLTIGAGLAITTTSPLPGGTVGTAYTQTLAASGGTSPYQWSVTTGTLPAGLALSAAGQLSGTPTAAGTASFTVQVKDSNSLTAT